MILEQRLTSLEKEVRRNRRVMVCLAVSLVVLVVAVGAAGPFPDLVCGTLQVKSGQGETSIRLEPGKMTVKVGEGFKDVGKKLIDLEGVERKVGALGATVAAIEKNVASLTTTIANSQVYITTRKYEWGGNPHWGTVALPWAEQPAFDKGAKKAIVVPEVFGRKVVGAWCVPIFYEDGNADGLFYLYAEPVNANQVQITYTRDAPWGFAFELVVAFQQ